jgi:uncharacterized lipoprotein YbaY
LIIVLFLVGETISGRVALSGDPSVNIPLPNGSNLQIQVLDVSKADAEARVMETLQIPNVASFPIAYQITYTPDASPPLFYSLSARITNGNDLLYINTEHVSTRVTENGFSVTDIPVERIH